MNGMDWVDIIGWSYISAGLVCAIAFVAVGICFKLWKFEEDIIITIIIGVFPVHVSLMVVGVLIKLWLFTPEKIAVRKEKRIMKKAKRKKEKS